MHCSLSHANGFSTDGQHSLGMKHRCNILISKGLKRYRFLIDCNCWSKVDTQNNVWLIPDSGLILHESAKIRTIAETGRFIQQSGVSGLLLRC